jgi:diguanylate cyclase (GGDEF)-like protein
VPLALVLSAAALLGALSLWATGWLGPVLGPPLPWLGFLAVAVAGSLHRPFAGRGLTLGAVALPPLAVLAGPLAAAWAALAAVLLAETGRTWAAAWLPVAPPTRPHPLATAAAAGRSALAALAGAVTLASLLARGLAAAGLAAAAVYAAVSLLGRMLERGGRLGRMLAAERDERGATAAGALRRRLPTRPELGSLAVETLAWTVGVAVAGAALLDAFPSTDGRRLALVLAAAFGLAALEAARLAGLRAAAEERLGQLDRVRSAGQRMVGGVAEMEAAVDRIREEVANVVPFQWFQFELLASERGDTRSWWSAGLGRAGGGELHDGEPRPDPHPPPLPGIHRRPEWRLVERTLAWGERTGARLRLWCDPRQLDGEDLELLDALLPQMSASIRQSLLDREAREDRLTGTAVRRVLEQRLLGAYRLATDNGSSLAVIMCDLDHFKAINDTHGHLTGDRALAACAAALAQHKRTGDLLARYGGEEFTLLLEDTDGDTALRVAERLRRAVEELEVEVDGTPVPLRVSAGVAAFPELHVKTAAELLLLADAALYEAKRGGRNRCLLDLGGGRYRTPAGDLVEAPGPRPEPEAPRIFA